MSEPAIQQPVCHMPCDFDAFESVQGAAFSTSSCRTKLEYNPMRGEDSHNCTADE